MGEVKKSIAFVTLHITDGGAERVSVELANEWKKKGYDITFIQLAPKMFDNQYEVTMGTKFINLEYKKNRVMRCFKWVSSLTKIMNSMPETVFIGFVGPAQIALGLSSIFAKNRIILSVRNDPRSVKSKLIRILRKFNFSRADSIVFQTKEQMDFFSKEVRKKAVIIPNPINSNLPEYNKGQREKKIISACRLDPQKNVPMMIQAFKKLLIYYPEYKFYIYGRGPLENEIRQLIKEEDLNNSVFLPGFTDNIYDEMNKSTMFLLSSNYEGISNSMLEAMAMGLPSVVTDCGGGGARMVVENNVNGILVPIGDVQAMFEGMKRILDDDCFAKKLSLNAMEVRNKYPVENIAEMWLEII